MYLKKILLISLIIVNSLGAYAEDVIYLDKGKAAPYDGYLFTPEKAKDTRLQLIEGDYNKDLVKSLTKTIDLYQSNEEISNKKVDLLLDQNDKLAVQLNSSRQVSNWEKVGYFLGGIIITGLAIKGVQALR